MTEIHLYTEKSNSPKKSWDSQQQEMHEIYKYFYNPITKEITCETYEEYTNLRRPENNETTLTGKSVISINLKSGQLYG